MKTLLFTLIFAVSALAQSVVSTTPDGSVTSQFGTKSEHLEFQTGSPSKAPYISLVNKGQGVHIAALPSGGILSIYRNIDGESKEWLRISAEGIQVVTENGIVPTLTGAPPPGCQVDYLHGLAVPKCPEAAKVGMTIRMENRINPNTPDAALLQSPNDVLEFGDLSDLYLSGPSGTESKGIVYLDKQSKSRIPKRSKPPATYLHAGTSSAAAPLYPSIRLSECPIGWQHLPSGCMWGSAEGFAYIPEKVGR